MSKITLNEYFVQINKNVITSCISDSAFRVYSFCISKPTGWRYFIKNIAKEMNKSESTIKRAFKELKEVGLLKCTIVGTENAKDYVFEFEMQSSKMNGGGFKNERGGGFKNDLHNNKEYNNIYNNTVDKKSTGFMDKLLIEFGIAYLQVYKYPYLDTPKDRKGIASLFGGLKKLIPNKDTDWWIKNSQRVFKELISATKGDVFMEKNLSTVMLASKLTYYQQFIKADKEPIVSFPKYVEY